MAGCLGRISAAWSSVGHKKSGEDMLRFAIRVEQILNYFCTWIQSILFDSPGVIWIILLALQGCGVMICDPNTSTFAKAPSATFFGIFCIFTVEAWGSMSEQDGSTIPLNK